MDDYMDDFEDFDDNDDYDDPLGLDEDDREDLFEDATDGNCDEGGALPDADADEYSENDGFSWKKAAFLGGAMGWAYEEGLRKRRKRKSRSAKVMR